MRIVFMGTPEFAVPSLKILVEHGYDVVGVITATDKYGGRGGKQLIESHVKKYAVEQGLHILQPKNLKDPKFVEELRSLQADLQIVVAFRMLPEVVWNMPTLGTYNLHGSLLPKYRGAAPIHWAVINGETETGVTSFKLKHKIDTGDLLFQEKTPIQSHESTGDVYHRLMALGAEVVLKTVQALESGEVSLLDQDESLVTKAPKLTSENTQIDLTGTAKGIHDFIRGLHPYPGAWLIMDEKRCVIQKATYLKCNHDIAPGKIITDQKSFLRLIVADGWVEVLHIKMQGKKSMDISSFLNGYEIENLTIQYSV